MSEAGPADGRAARWEAHRIQRRVDLVVAGAAAIDRFGAEAGAEQFAEAAGVSRTVLYRYFRDLDELRQAVADHVVSAVVQSVLPTLALGPESTPRQVITGAIGVVVGWFDEHPNLYTFLRNRPFGGALEAVEVTLADQVAALLRALMGVLGVEGRGAEPAAYGIVGLVEATCGWWLARRADSGLDRDQLTDLICASVWHVLRGVALDRGVEIDYDAPLAERSPQP